MDGGQKTMKNSLRRQLSGWIAVATILCGIIAGGFSFFLAFQEAQELQDNQLRQVALLMGRTGGTVEDWTPAVSNIDDREQGEPDDRIIIRHLGRSARTALPNRTSALADVPADLAEGFQTVTSHGDTWRLYVYTLRSGNKIAVGQLTEVRNDAARDSGLSTLFPVLLLVPFLTLLTTWVVRRSLATVTDLSKLLDQRNDTNLSALPEVGVPYEISPFVVSINSLMRRLSESLEQQRRFIADAAHELRSPLTALTLQAENLDRSSCPTERSDRLQQLKQGLARIRSLLDQLLSLARQQSSNGPTTEIRLDLLVWQVLEDLMPMALAKGVDLGCERFDEVVVTAPGEELGILVRNAIDNAVRYTPAGGTVDVGVFIEERQVVFQVTDNGPGIPNGEEERLFEPFYRVMGTDETGSGLGLAIVRSIADRQGGSVTLNNRENSKGVLFRYTCQASFR
jgi:two-component system OmpR family sensor kinase